MAIDPDSVPLSVEVHFLQLPLKHQMTHSSRQAISVDPALVELSLAASSIWQTRMANVGVKVVERAAGHRQVPKSIDTLRVPSNFDVWRRFSGVEPTMKPMLHKSTR